MTTASPEENQVTGWLAGQHEAMVKLLAEMVNTDSGSYDKAGVDAAGEVLKRFFAAEGLAVETVPQVQYGDQIKATLDQPASNDKRPIVLMGHRDTVFPKGEPTRRSPCGPIMARTFSTIARAARSRDIRRSAD